MVMLAPCPFGVPKIKTSRVTEKKKKRFATFFLVILGSFVSKKLTE